MVKLMFAPLRFLASRLAGVTGKRTVARVWGAVDDRGRPTPEDRTAGWGRLLAALALEGAVLRVVSGAFDHASRRWFARLTGRWPGPEAPKPDDD
ncbi:MAG TPA: DUF4235 domain-containing protein [Solirubrobacteraceae bacterium]|nr:DUF4235 domain-containing protein [Solirubrobacteraceae bacterium]